VKNKEQNMWDRQPHESSKAYAHFCLYRDMGRDRSLRKLAQDAKCISKVAQLRRWSSRWRWVERSQRYDDYLEHQDRLRQEKERKDMLSRHAKIAVLVQSLAVKATEKLIAQVEQGNGDLTASEVSRLLDVGVKVERLSRAEPAQMPELEQPGEQPARGNIEDRAREGDGQVLANEIMAIADTPKMVPVVKSRSDGTKEVMAVDMTGHRRLQIDVRKWLLSKLCPHKYGPKVEVQDGRDPLEELIKEMDKQYEFMVKEKESRDQATAPEQGERPA
jgi:hypothetical protein